MTICRLPKIFRNSLENKTKNQIIIDNLWEWEIGEYIQIKLEKEEDTSEDPIYLKKHIKAIYEISICWSGCCSPFIILNNLCIEDFIIISWIAKYDGFPDMWDFFNHYKLNYGDNYNGKLIILEENLAGFYRDIIENNGRIDFEKIK
jgi:hypothetical protein